MRLSSLLLLHRILLGLKNVYSLEEGSSTDWNLIKITTVDKPFIALETTTTLSFPTLVLQNEIPSTSTPQSDISTIIPLSSPSTSSFQTDTSTVIPSSSSAISFFQPDISALDSLDVFKDDYEVDNITENITELVTQVSEPIPTTTTTWMGFRTTLHNEVTDFPPENDTILLMSSGTNEKESHGNRNSFGESRMRPKTLVDAAVINRGWVKNPVETVDLKEKKSRKKINWSEIISRLPHKKRTLVIHDVGSEYQDLPPPPGARVIEFQLRRFKREVTDTFRPDTTFSSFPTTNTDFSAVHNRRRNFNPLMTRLLQRMEGNVPTVEGDAKTSFTSHELLGEREGDIFEEKALVTEISNTERIPIKREMLPSPTIFDKDETDSLTSSVGSEALKADLVELNEALKSLPSPKTNSVIASSSERKTNPSSILTFALDSLLSATLDETDRQMNINSNEKVDKKRQNGLDNLELLNHSGDVSHKLNIL